MLMWDSSSLLFILAAPFLRAAPFYPYLTQTHETGARHMHSLMCTLHDQSSTPSSHTEYVLAPRATETRNIDFGEAEAVAFGVRIITKS